ncbi:AAA family ATPase [uncultured Lamprocystis sp.]|jgi:type II secretory pathway predicted ATPase ExeA|uniref:ExeA family protein n=1 Tax=uncultured Lamprocystis sp. TaxID=543132 RepID=UPI0025DC65FD|nr:AAA family ATPase [uncultured Lamprocystis sp.]
MQSEVMKHFGLTRGLPRAGYFETAQQRRVFDDIKIAIHGGQLLALVGLVGCGKTTTLHRLTEALKDEREILVSQSLAVDKHRINLGTLMLALFYDLVTEKDFKVPTQPEKRERKLIEVIAKRKKPVALFVDEAHDLHPKTLVGLKRLIELVQNNGGTLSVVLVGHPKLRNDLRRPALEEIGARTTLFWLDGIKGQELAYLDWLLEQCAPATAADLLTTEARERLAAALSTPLQIEQYLTLALEAAYQVGQKPVTLEVIEAVLAADIDALEATLTRYGYNTRALADLLNVRPAEIRSFLHGQLAPGRTQELHGQLLAAGLPV